MKKIFIYYSLTGNGNLVADLLSKKDIEIRRVFPKRSLPKNFTLRIMIGGFKASIKYKDRLKNFDSDISNFDEVIIGSPIWNKELSSPINKVLSLLDLSNKKVIFVLYSGSGEAQNAKELIKNKYPKSKIIVLKEPLKNPEKMIEKLKEI